MNEVIKINESINIPAEQRRECRGEEEKIKAKFASYRNLFAFIRFVLQLLLFDILLLLLLLTAFVHLSLQIFTHIACPFAALRFRIPIPFQVNQSLVFVFVFVFFRFSTV